MSDRPTRERKLTTIYTPEVVEPVKRSKKEKAAKAAPKKGKKGKADKPKKVFLKMALLVMIFDHFY